MFYQGIIFDLDDTLYSYTNCHIVSLDAVIEYLKSKYANIDFHYQYKILSDHLKR